MALDLDGDRSARPASRSAASPLCPGARTRPRRRCAGQLLDEASAERAAEAAFARREDPRRQRLQARARPPHAGARAARGQADGDLVRRTHERHPNRQASSAGPRRASTGAAKVTGAARYASDLRGGRTRPVPSSSPAPSPRAGSPRSTRPRHAGARRARHPHPREHAGDLKPTELLRQRRHPAPRMRPLDDRPRSTTTARSSPWCWPRRFEAAREARLPAAGRLCRGDALAPTFDAPGRRAGRAKDAVARAARGVRRSATPMPPSPRAAVTIEADYATPTQHHNPIELFTTTAIWDDDRLTIYEPSQFVHGLRNGARRSSSASTPRGAGASAPMSAAPSARGLADAAHRADRPRGAPAEPPGEARGHARPGLHHRHLPRRDAAPRHARRRPDGKLVGSAMKAGRSPRGPTPTRSPAPTTPRGSMPARTSRTKVSIVHADRNTPGFMRSPPEVPYIFALESAMDELAVQAGHGPDRAAPHQRHA